jgi:hypothetical protein
MSGMLDIFQVIIEIIANNPPSIAIAMGGLMIFTGSVAPVNGLVTAGWIFFIVGVILQILWLYYKGS